jgi:hypothetical protein
MPGFMQFITGTYLFLGLTLFHSFVAPALYATHRSSARPASACWASSTSAPGCG